jgi:hypothetical protein
LPRGEEVRIEQSRKRSAAENTYTELSSQSWPRLHRHPNVSTAVLCFSFPLPCSLLPGSAPSSRRAPFIVVSPWMAVEPRDFSCSLSPQQPHAAVLDAPVCESMFCCLSFVKPRTIPRRAAVPCALRHAVPQVSVDRPSCRGDLVQGPRVRELWPCTP